MKNIFLFWYLFFISSVAGWTSLMPLKLVPNTIGGVCLDGTPPGYYWRPAQSTTSQNNWIISIFGGGWCYNEEDCYQRSKTQLGSSTLWPPVINGTAVLSGDPSVNPDFWDWNMAYIIYCDGASFSGNKDQPINMHGSNIYFRGARCLDAVLNDLLQMGMANAKQVMLTGCSAGGLSTFLHADYVASRLPPSVVRYKAFPQSGYFLPAPNLLNQPVYIDQMKYVFVMQNVTNNINDLCIKSVPIADQWLCFFAPGAYNFIKTPIFIFNSYYDIWQMLFILGVNVPSFSNCASKGPQGCTNQEIQVVDIWRQNFLTLIETSPTYKNPKNGVFLHSCWTHCASIFDDKWEFYQINGVSIRVAVGNWFFERTPQNNFIDCMLTSPNNCNPTCVL